MITIAIPALNEAKHIGALLDSLAVQDFNEDIEVIVADAGSTDATREVVESYGNRFARVEVVPGGMPAVGRNHAARAGAGDPIFFIDADIIIPDHAFLQESVAYFREHNLAVAAALLVPRSEKTIDKLGTHALNVIHRVMQFAWPGGIMCVVARRDVFEKVGGYPEDVLISEDYDFVAACAKHGRCGILQLPVTFSVRRLEKDGRVNSAWKYIKVLVHRALFGPVRKPIVEYDFHYSEREDGA